MPVHVLFIGTGVTLGYTESFVLRYGTVDLPTHAVLVVLEVESCVVECLSGNVFVLPDVRFVVNIRYGVVVSFSVGLLVMLDMGGSEIVLLTNEPFTDSCCRVVAGVEEGGEGQWSSPVGLVHS